MQKPRQKTTETKIKCLSYNLEVNKKENQAKQEFSEIEKSFYPFGFTKNEIKVYLCLATSGVLKAHEISERLSIHRTETYRLLRSLENRGIVSVILEKPLKFKSIPFSEAYDILIKTQKLNIMSLKDKKTILLDKWSKIPKKTAIETKEQETFQVIEGHERVTLKFNQISEEALQEVYVLMPDMELYRLYRSQFIENINRHNDVTVKISIITNSSPKSRAIIEKMKIKNVKFIFCETVDLPSFIIKDQKEVLMSIEKSNDYQQNENIEKDPIYLKTNYFSIIKTLNLLFNNLWKTNPPMSVEKILNA